MSIEGELKQMAHEVVSRAQHRASGLNREYLEAQKVAADLKAKLDFANLSLDRLANFKVKIGTNYQCPTCWIDREARVAFHPVSSQTRDDIFRCQYGHGLVITY
jgi:hypothetical protein